MDGCDVHSLKPFLLDSILTWSSMEGFTPVLVTSAHPERKLPACLLNMSSNPLAFKLSDKAIIERAITTDHIMFKTPFQQSQQWETVVLPVDSWVSLRITEIGHVFDFAFPEHISAVYNKEHGIWPMGLFTHKSSFALNGPEERTTTPAPSLRACKRRPVLSLVWSDGSPVAPRS